jgi:hypothetical protein
MQLPSTNPEPPEENIEHIVRCLVDLRNACVIASQALRDYQFSLESQQRQWADQQAQHLIETSRSRSRQLD